MLSEWHQAMRSGLGGDRPPPDIAAISNNRKRTYILTQQLQGKYLSMGKPFPKSKKQTL
jgi:hypothetical protein